MAHIPFYAAFCKHSFYEYRIAKFGMYCNENGSTNFRIPEKRREHFAPGAFSVFLMPENDSITYRLRVSWSLPQMLQASCWTGRIPVRLFRSDRSSEVPPPPYICYILIECIAACVGYFHYSRLIVCFFRFYF